MPYVITQNCCKDASCVTVCPVNCIHPAPPEDGFVEEPMLYVDPRACIDCGACADACPVDAIVPADTLQGPERVYVQLNADHFADVPVAPASGPLFRTWDNPTFDWSLPSDFAGLDVAVIGTGPAGMYAAELLLLHTQSRVTLIDRLPMAGGLVRYGVAPDHPGTKRIGETFARLYGHPRVRMLLGVEVGTAVTAEQLAEHFDAVIYAVGASVGKRLGVPGEELPGSVTAPEFVGWYNSHPDVAPGLVAPRHPRAVVVGSGNVALDVARILSSDPAALGATDIADHALVALADRPVREVVLLARRGPAEAAYSAPELIALRDMGERHGVELVVDDHDPRTREAIDASPVGSKAALLRSLRRVRPGYEDDPGPDRRIVLRFHAAVERVTGTDHVAGIDLAGGDHLACGLLVTSIGYGGRPLPGLPFDEARGIVPNEAGRVEGRTGAYAVGWCKRGSSGGIGDNRTDAAETVRTLLDDAVAGRLSIGGGGAKAVARLAGRAGAELVDAEGLRRILAAEHARGQAAGRPAAKFATVTDLVAASRRRRLSR